MNHNSEKKWQQLVTALADGVLITDNEGVILYVNNQAALIFGRGCAELKGENFLYPLGTNETQEIEIIQSNGQIVMAEMNIRLGAWNEQTAWIISLRDITQKKLKENRLELAARVFDNAHEGIMVTDAQGDIVDLNQAFSDLTGYSKKELIGQNPRILKSSREGRDFYREMWAQIQDIGVWEGELWERRKNGNEFPVHLSISTLKSEEGEVLNYIIFCHDLIIQKKQQEQINRLKYYDALTSLPNQYFLSKNLDSMMQYADELKTNLVIIYISINGLKSKNHSNFSSVIKNKLILLASKRLSLLFKEPTFLARISYQEFIVVFNNRKNIMEILPKIQNLIIKLGSPYKIHEKKITLTTSVGITSYPQEQILYPEELIRQAHLAGYEAKLQGDNQFKFFDSPSEIKKIKYNEQIDALRKAMLNGSLSVFYQPKVNMSTGKILGAEALIRLNHPEKGLLTPEQFIPDIENHPISIEIGEWVLSSVLMQLEEWTKHNIAIPISINIAPYHLQQPDFLANLEDILARHPSVNNKLIELEILETQALKKITEIKRLINDCKKIGILFALDDFGTGYSSLTHLKELPVNTVKLDQSFVRDIMNKPENIAILKACISMCTLLKREIIAEGVETISLGKLLLYLGCNLGQGYSIAFPMPAKFLQEWVKNWIPLPQWKISPQGKKEGKLLINAAIAHHSKLEAVKHFLTSNGAKCPICTAFSCSLGRWLHRQISTSATPDPHLYKLESIHNKIHTRAKKIIQSYHSGNTVSALTEIDKLELLSNKLLNQLLSLKLGQSNRSL